MSSLDGQVLLEPLVFTKITCEVMDFSRAASPYERQCIRTDVKPEDFYPSFTPRTKDLPLRLQEHLSPFFPEKLTSVEYFYHT